MSPGSRFVDDIRPNIESKPPRFIDQLRLTIRQQGLSYATEKTYVHWIVRFIRFCRLKHPSELGAAEVTRFLNYLAIDLHCAVSTQRTALNALVFLFERHLQAPLGELEFRYARKQRRMPTVFAHHEAMQIISQLSNPHDLIAGLMYGAGLRLSEALNLRIKDLDFAQQQLTVRDGKGGNERMTLLPGSLYEPLQEQIDVASTLHAMDRRRGYGSVFMPDALERKYPNASQSTGWQFVFPSQSLAQDPRSDVIRRHHLHATSVQRAVARAIRRSAIRRRASCHTFRHSFATRLIETGYDIKLVQSLLGHRDIRTTEIYLHVVRNRGGAIRSPVDQS